MDQQDSTADDRRFEWHPTYQGRTVTEVADALRTELERDQRAYALALDGADQHEQSALASVIELEKRWGAFDMGWAEADPQALANRIAAFEAERERRRDLFPYAEIRANRAVAAEMAEASARPWWAFWKR